MARRPDLPLEDATAMEVAWVGDGAPRGASKVTPTAYRNRLARSPVDGAITATVVCNDPRVDEESQVADVYGGQEDGVEVTGRGPLTTDELAGVLAEDAEFLHYVGHVDDEGLRCVDGHLDAGTLPDVGIETFLLNACDSLEQGMALVEAGAVGGIVTLRQVTDDSALRMGSTVARLLDLGYPLRPALEVARHASYVGDDYVVVGDGTVTVANATTTSLDVYRLRPGGDVPVLEFRTYANAGGGMGTMTKPDVADNDRYYVSSGVLDEFQPDTVEELLAFLGRMEVPVLVGEALHWSTELGREQLPAGSGPS